MRQFLLALSIVATLAISSLSQTKVEKISSEEYIEANELSRKFFARFAQTMDLKPLIQDLGTSDFYDCIDKVDSEQTGTMSKAMKKRYFLAETNFLMAIFMWGTRSSGSNDVFDFKMLPKRVQKIITKQTFDAWIKDSDSVSSFSMGENRTNLNSILRKLEQSTPIFRDEVINAGSTKSQGFRKAMRFLEFDSTVSKYLFRPELGRKEKACGSVSLGGRVIYADIPFFQLQMVKVNGRLRIHQIFFHID